MLNCLIKIGAIAEKTAAGVDYGIECTKNVKATIQAFESCYNKLELDKFITHEVSFANINEAFDYMING